MPRPLRTPIGRLEPVDGGGRVNRLLATHVKFARMGLTVVKPEPPKRSWFQRLLRRLHLAG